MSEIRSQATPARDELAEKIQRWLTSADKIASTGFSHQKVRLCESMGFDWRETIAALQKALPRTVNSATELDALPVNTCGVDDGDHYWIRHSKNWHCSCDGADVEWSSENLWEEINLGGPGTFTVLFTSEDAG